MQFELTDFETSPKQRIGMHTVQVDCIARHPRENAAGFEEYEVSFYRDPVTGNVRDICVTIPEETTEHTLTENAIRDKVWDYLYSL